MSDTSDAVSIMQGLSNSLNTLSNNVTSAEFHSLKNFKKWTKAQNELNYDYQTKLGDYNNKQMRDNTLWSLSTGKAAEIAGLKAAGLNPAMMGDSASMVSMASAGDNGSPGSSPYDPSSRKYDTADFMSSLVQGAQIRQTQSSIALQEAQAKYVDEQAKGLGIDNSRKQSEDAEVKHLFGLVNKGALNTLKEFRDYAKDTAVARMTISESELKQAIADAQLNNKDAFDALVSLPDTEKKKALAVISNLGAQTKKLLTDEKFVKEQIETELYKQNKLASETKLMGQTFEQTQANIAKLDAETQKIIQDKLLARAKYDVSLDKYLSELTPEQRDLVYTIGLSSTIARNAVDNFIP